MHKIYYLDGITPEQAELVAELWGKKTIKDVVEFRELKVEERRNEIDTLIKLIYFVTQEENQLSSRRSDFETIEGLMEDVRNH